MRKVFDSVNSGDGVAEARGKQARLDVMVCTRVLLAPAHRAFVSRRVW
jgi:hypothetical protein